MAKKPSVPIMSTESPQPPHQSCRADTSSAFWGGRLIRFASGLHCVGSGSFSRYLQQGRATPGLRVGHLTLDTQCCPCASIMKALIQETVRNWRHQSFTTAAQTIRKTIPVLFKSTPISSTQLLLRCSRSTTHSTNLGSLVSYYYITYSSMATTNTCGRACRGSNCFTLKQV